MCYTEGSDEDFRIANLITNELESRHLTGYLEDRDSVPGQSIVSSLGDVLNKVKKIILLITSESINNNWFTFKMHSSIVNELDETAKYGNNNRIIPIYSGVGLNQKPDIVAHLHGAEFYETPSFYDLLERSLIDED